MYSNESDDDSRLYQPCPSLTSGRVGPTQLVRTCNDECGGRYFAACCWHRRRKCHHRQVVFTDGACMNNGREGSVAGIGVAFGTDIGDPEDEYSDGQQFSLPVDDRLDPGGNRTSQRAELLAALYGLKKVCDYEEENFAEISQRRWRNREPDKTEVIITTDSEYVVKGMTEWLPTWKRNNLRRSNGQRPSNLDLFLELDSEVNKREREHDIKIMFWHIGREYNTVADGLAKRGARLAASSGGFRVERVSAFHGEDFAF